MPLSIQDGQFLIALFQKVLAGINQMSQGIQNINMRLDAMEITMSSSSDVLSRLQTDAANVAAQNVQETDDLTALLQAQSDELARIAVIIAGLRGSAGGVDPVAASAVADQLEAALTGLSAVHTGIAAATQTEVSDEASVVITPGSVTLAPGSTQQFTANVPVKWSAQSGSIDQTGMYTTPSDQTITTDNVGAVSSQDSGLDAVVVVTIAAPVAGSTASTGVPAAATASLTAAIAAGATPASIVAAAKPLLAVSKAATVKQAAPVTGKPNLSGATKAGK